jgi:hypothetical protein
MAQNRHLFHEQPKVTWKMSDLASEGGLNRGISYSIGYLLDTLLMMYVFITGWCVGPDRRLSVLIILQMCFS